MIGTIILLCLLFLIILMKYFNHNEIKEVEGFESETFLVRNLGDKDKAAEMLSKIRSDLITCSNKMINDIENNDNDTDATQKKYYKNLCTIRDRLPNAIIKESIANSEYTSYSINKGEELVFCLRSKNTDELHDYNEIMYVAIHEAAHIGCPEIGHTPLFYKINKYLLKGGIKHKIYNYINYKLDNREYCGLTLTSTIL